MCFTCTLEAVTGVDSQELEDGWTAEIVEGVEWPKATHGMVALAKLRLALYDCTSAGTGGPMHVFTDDYNVEDEILDACEAHIEGYEPYDEATEADVALVKAISRRMIELAREMTEAERAVALSLSWGELTADRDGNVRRR